MTRRQIKALLKLVDALDGVHDAFLGAITDPEDERQLMECLASMKDGATALRRSLEAMAPDPPTQKRRTRRDRKE